MFRTSDNSDAQQERFNEQQYPGEGADDIPINDDLEDGEIEDDEEEDAVPADNAVPQEQVAILPVVPEMPTQNNQPASNTINNKFGQSNRGSNNTRLDRHNRYEDRKRGHLTEAEKSVMHLHKLERLERIERDKRDRFKREPSNVVDDFASTVEKAIASVLKKDKKQGGSDDDKEEEEKRGKKRKKKEKDKKKPKQRKIASPKAEEYDENEMMNIRKGSPEPMKTITRDETHSPSPRSDYDSYESSESSDRSREDRKDWKSEKHGGKKARSKNRDQARGGRKGKGKAKEQKPKDEQDPVCLFYLQGKCTKGEECPYSHEVPIPMKLELCKFYLMDCCAKRDKCLYMHSEFPCKYYHTGLRCQAGDSCKFAHGKPLNEGLKQILYKHIETAPKEILGDFPRLSRDGALNMINQTQKNLEVKYGEKKDDRTMIPSLFELDIPVPNELLPKDLEAKAKEKNDKPIGRERSRPSRWQDADPAETLAIQEQQKLQLTFGLKGFYSECDQDMRINSNGDIDMRTLPPQLNALLQLPSETATTAVDMNQFMRDASMLNNEESQLDLDARLRPHDVDIRQVDFSKDIDIRQISQFHMNQPMDDNDNAADEPNLEIVVEEENVQERTDYLEPAPDESTNLENPIENAPELPIGLPKKQRELFMRIQSQQKENIPENDKDCSDDEDNRNIDWYSDDDDDCRLTIKDDLEEIKQENPIVTPPAIKPVEVIEKLGDLSKIDISEEVTKLLSSISQVGFLKEKREPPKDPRLASVHAMEAPKPSPIVPELRRSRLSSTECRKVEKMSIYEQGSMSIENASRDVDLRSVEHEVSMRSTFGDTDLRSSPIRPDIDLRQLGLPFKAIQNYTPASEIDASISSHLPMVWKVHIVEIPRPDYSGLKLSAHEAQHTGDPRLRKIFKLNGDDKESPLSPNASPKQSGVRVDPRRRRDDKLSDNIQMSYAQQLNILQTSAFYNSLTSNQKVLLNEELSKSDNLGSNDPTLNGILTNLGLVPGPSMILPSGNNNAGNASALTILASVNSMMGQPAMVQNQQFVTQQVNPNILAQNPNLVNQMAQSMVTPGLLGAAPGVPNLVPEFQLNFDPRQGGLLGNAPQVNYNDNGNFNNNYNNGNEDYFEGNNYNENGGGRGGSGRGRGGFRERQPRRGRNFNSNRNSGGRNFRNRNNRNNNNRNRTSP